MATYDYYVYCPFCGNRLERGDAYCRYCGQKIPAIDRILENFELTSHVDVPDAALDKKAFICICLVGCILLCFIMYLTILL
ncbi:MAG: zinc-ribbon domain-containing protein [Megasphaera sp.]|uniref:zinc-ribbon domain-containing protein n=1 Tax=Megasphaera sp. TaxID=2023260 RepID=UPI003F0637ED